jgi:PBSX family phage terminase large subunit
MRTVSEIQELPNPALQVRRPEAVWYQPLPSQRKFHSAMGTSFKGFSGPIGSGKSQAMAYETVISAVLNPGCIGLVGAPTFPMLRDATQRALFDTLERQRIDYAFNQSRNILTFPENSVFEGAQILFRSMDHFERIRGTNLAWFGVDELTYCKEEAWLRLVGRLRDPAAKHRIGFACWTPKGFDWVYERFIKEDREDPENYSAVLASPGENIHLPAAFYSTLGKSYDRKFFAQEVLGQYLSVFSGQVYHAYDPKENVRPVDWDPAMPLLWALDFNVDPMSSVICQRHERPGELDVVNVLNELVIANSDTHAACEAFRERTEKWADVLRRRLPVIVYGDANGDSRKTSGETDYRIIKQFFARHSDTYDAQFKFGRSNPRVRDRVNAVNGMLCNADGVRRLLHHPRCKELAKDFQQVVYQVDSHGSTIPALDKSDPKRSHVSDALSYLIWAEFPIRSKCGFGTGPIF